MSCKSTKTSSTAARERELFLYYEPETPQPPQSNSTTCPGGSGKASSDPCLTAFAQLGALRFRARRGLITLSTGNEEFILAESGQELSLQQDDDEKDKLWHGVGVLSNENIGMGPAITDVFSRPDPPSHFLVGDLTQDDRFKNKQTVVEFPYLRAIAAVPLVSAMHGVIIGTYIVVDDKVRSPLSEDELQFLTDMSTTVSDYLEAGRLKKVQHRAERMVKAIGLFIEGKSSLRDWWLERGHKFQTDIRKRSKEITPLERQADLEFGVQETVDYFSRHGLHGLQNGHRRSSMTNSQESSSAPPSHGGTPSVSTDPGPIEARDGRPPLPPRDAFLTASTSVTPMTSMTSVTQSWQHRNSSVTTFDTATDPTPEPEKHSSVSFELPPTQTPQPPPEDSHELQNALLTADIRNVFARASNLIREAIGVEGVVYFDASIGSFGGSSDKNAMEEKAPGSFNADHVVGTSEDDLAKKSSDTDGEKQQKATESHCNVLGYSTRRRSSLHCHRVSDELQKFPEQFLRKLLKRYPHGKVFNFDEDGCFSSSESDHVPSTTPDSDPPKADPAIKSRRRMSREQEAAEILSVLPGARSVFWYPLWDQNRERWYSGSLVWSTSTARTLCPIEDITYLAAFGNSTMAEISRLSALSLSRMKTDFISSISHELRSPLHGVLASVEFLQETEMTEVQTDMVNNINASAKVLLDTITHVLDFSKVNRRAKNKKRISKHLRRKPGSKENVEDGIEKADMCIVSEEVVETIYAGAKVVKNAFSAPGNRAQGAPAGGKGAPLTVIMDIAWRENWTYEIDKGAWRRILMNLVTNAMKYTSSGFVKVSLAIEESEKHPRKHASKEYLVLKVKDSGKGIHAEFLKHQLYKPFSQEDNLASGAGLGLSIVKAIIHDLGGKIDFTSEPGTGTEATVRIPLIPSAVPKKVEERGMVSSVREKCAGMKAGLVGFDRYPDLEEEPTGILDREAEAAMLLKDAVKNSFQNWFGIDVASTSESPDVVVVMEGGLGEKCLLDVLEEHGHGHGGEEKRTAIVLTDKYHSGPKVDAHEHFRIFYLQQPYSPHKVARILHQSFCQTEASQPEQIKENPAKSPIPNSIEVPTSMPPESPTATYDFASPPVPPDPAASSEPPRLWVPVSQRSPHHPPAHTIHPMYKGTPSTSVPPSDTLNVTPLPQSQPPPPPPESPKEESKPGLRVLLVEDNEINLKLLIATMRKLKLDHATAMNGLEALNAYKECVGKFDVIFMDISMPIMSGIESTRHIRRFESENRLQPVAVIALTGAANANTRQEAFSSGVDLYLTKPVPMKALRSMLGDLEREGRSAFAG